MENIILIMLLTTCLGILCILQRGVNELVKIKAKEAEFNVKLKMLDIESQINIYQQGSPLKALLRFKKEREEGL